VPALRLTAQPGLKPNASRKASHKLRPKGRKEKESKAYISSKFRRAVWWAANIVTEACDVVDAFYDAIPFKERQKYEKSLARFGSWRNWERYEYTQRNLPNWAKEENQLFGKGAGACRMKAYAVWEDWEKVDLGQAMKNVIYQQMQDTIIGSTSKYANKGYLQNARGRPLGLTAGPAL